MEELKQLLPQKQQVTSVNLEFCEIENIENYLPVLSQFPKLNELLLFGNRIESLPRDLSALQNLQTLDISNNMITHVEDVLDGLVSLPFLHDLHITLNSESDEQILIKSLPKLQRLNGSDIDKDIVIEMADNIEYNEDQLQLKQEDLEQVAILYDQIRDLWRAVDASMDKILAQDFDESIKDIMMELQDTVQSPQPPFLVHTTMINARFKLFAICQNKLNLLVKRNNKSVGGLLQDISNQTFGLFKETITVIQNMHTKYSDKIAAMKADMEKAMKETAQVLEAAEQLEKQATGQSFNRSYLKQEYEQEIQQLKEEVDSLTQENKKYLDMIIKQSKQSADSILSNSVIEQDTSRSKSYAQLVGRTLTLKQLTDVIDAIYASKLKHDTKCQDGKQPRETMEQHMYTFLNKKYGLKNLIIEWAGAIIAGIKKYQSEDNDVAVFGKILRNECDEEFRFVQVQVKETVAELLKMHLKGKFPLKSNQDIQQMVNEKTTRFLQEEEWSDIVRYMYNDIDSKVLIQHIRDIGQQKQAQQEQNSKSRQTREELKRLRDNQTQARGKINYQDFLKALLDFQMKGHEKFLSPFVKIYRKYDQDHDGVINESEFYDLVNDMDIGLTEEDIMRLLHIIDPYNNQQITFSECVTLFSTEVLSEKEPIGILQKLASLQLDNF